MRHSSSTVTILCASLVLFCGCPTQQSPAPAPQPAAPAEPSQDHVGHSHDFGLHGGSLAVLGSHQFHAEALANEESGEVEIRIYTGSNKPTTLNVKELTLNRTIDRKPKQYTLSVADGGETTTFKISDKELAEVINDRTWDGELQVLLMLDGVPCSGNLSKKKPTNHDHDH